MDDPVCQRTCRDVIPASYEGRDRHEVSRLSQLARCVASSFAVKMSCAEKYGKSMSRALSPESRRLAHIKPLLHLDEVGLIHARGTLHNHSASHLQLTTNINVVAHTAKLFQYD